MSTLARLARALARLPAAHVNALLPLRALALRATMPGALDAASLASLLESLSAPAIRGPPRPLPATAERLLRPIGRWRTTCLYRALARFALLRARGVDARFVIGVRSDRGELSAHEWLERDGVPLGEEPGSTEGFRVAFRHPPGGDGAPGARAPEVLLTELDDGEGVLLDLRSNSYFTLNRSGVFVWRHLAAGGTAEPDAIAASLASRFGGVEPARAKEDVRRLLDALAAEGLLRT